jgi:hypothetical protein
LVCLSLSLSLSLSRARSLSLLRVRARGRGRGRVCIICYRCLSFPLALPPLTPFCLSLHSMCTSSKRVHRCVYECIRACVHARTPSRTHKLIQRESIASEERVTLIYREPSARARAREREMASADFSRRKGQR